MRHARLRDVAVILALVLARPTRGHAQPTAGSSPAAREVAAVLARVDSALARRDTTALAALLTDTFRWIGPADGRVDTRSTWLTKAAGGLALAGMGNDRSQRTVHGAELALYGTPDPQTAVRTSRVRLRTPGIGQENWWVQTVVLVRERGAWRLAFGQGTYLYSGAPQDSAALARYAGTYVIDAARSLALEWEGAALLATYPDGTQAPVFLASPDEQAVMVRGAGALHFTLGADGRVVEVAFVRRGVSVWRAARRAP